MVALGQIVSTEVELNKVHRLHLLENCSLEIKNVAVEDAGVYHCKQYQSTRYPVELAVISSKSFTPQILVDQNVQQLFIISMLLVVTNI